MEDGLVGKNYLEQGMYSLYRAWLSLSPCRSIPTFPPLPVQNNAINLSVPVQYTGSPDVTLQVGPTMTQFSAHRTVLSNHSGFFKAALSNLPACGPIPVPNVNVDEFSSLLTFMYTGYLDLNISNIYNILLATHILHMPRALELCRNFLMQNQPLETHTTVIKPIPSRKSAPPHQQIYAPTFSNLQKSEGTPFHAIAPEKQEVVSYPSTSKCGQPQRQNESGAQQAEAGKKKHQKSGERVVIDIACCDGPVRFHRVLNKNYGVSGAEGDYLLEKVDRNDVMNKVMNENIRDKLEDENRSQNAGTDVFTCLYCNHTFKSQYCYQKHARRHLNPVSIESKTTVQVDSNVTTREFKLLDMNVQYYPCKTCGSKFPSYYFVHKHRKMCHAEEMADTSNKNNEIMLENNCGTTDSSKTSVIDVETEENK